MSIPTLGSLVDRVPSYLPRQAIVITGPVPRQIDAPCAGFARNLFHATYRDGVEQILIGNQLDATWKQAASFL